MLDPEGPSIAYVDDYEPTKVVQKVDILKENKWIKLDLLENDEGDLIVKVDEGNEEKSLFRKRGG